MAAGGKARIAINVLLMIALAAAVYLWHNDHPAGSHVLFTLLDFDVTVLAALFWPPVVILSHQWFAKWGKFNEIMGSTPLTRFLVLGVFLLGVLAFADLIFEWDTLEVAGRFLEGVTSTHAANETVTP